MARKRLIAPTFFTHADLYDAEAASGLPLRLAFAALWCQADRRGVFVWKPRELKLSCLPYDAVDFAQVLEALASHGFVMPYEVDGRHFGLIPSFARWQSFHRDERPSDAPMPQEHGADTVPAPCDHGFRMGHTQGEHRTKRPVTVTVTASSTAPSTASIAAAVQPSGDTGADTVAAARRLTAAANRGISEQFGEQPVPIRWDHPSTAATVAALGDLHVPLEEAERLVYDMARTRTPSNGRPPRTLRYYADAVVQAWWAEQAHRDAATLPRPEASASVITYDEIERRIAERRGTADAA